MKGLKSDVFNLKWKLFKQYLVKNNLNYELYMPGSKKQILQTIEIIKDKIRISEEEKKRIKKMGTGDYNVPKKNKKKYVKRSSK